MYGDMYFTPEMMKNNKPTKLNSSFYFSILITSLLFWICVGIGVIGLNSFLSSAATLPIIGFSYIIYIITSCGYSEVRKYISKTKGIK